MDWDKLKEARKVEAPPRPPNTFTSQEYADHEKIQLRAAQRQLGELFRRGKIKKANIVVKQDGYLRHTSAWQLVE